MTEPNEHTLQLVALISSRTEPDYDQMRALIAQGADVHVRLNMVQAGYVYTMLPEQSDLMYVAAALANFPKVLDVLLEAGLHISRSTPKTHYSPLHVATFTHYNPVMAKALIERGANVNQRDHAGESPLHNAAIKNMRDVVQLMLESRADLDVNLPNKSGLTPIERAVESASVQAVELLVKAGAAIRPQIFNLVTHYAMFEERQMIHDTLRAYQTRAGDVWERFIASPTPDVTTLSAQDICLFANIGKLNEVMQPEYWKDQPQTLSKLLGSLPLSLSGDILRNQPRLQALLTPQSQIDGWSSQHEGAAKPSADLHKN